MSTKTKKKCNDCQRFRPVNDFYASQSILFADGRVPLCKKCIKEMMDENDIDSIKRTLQIIDKPFIAKVWKSAEESGGDVVGNYFRMINSLHQYKNYTWDDSDFQGEKDTVIYEKKFDNIEDIEELETENGTIELTKDLVMKFGAGYSNIEYLNMEKFYQEMSMTHNVTMPQHRKQLITLCKLNVQMDRALEEGDSSAFKRYNDSYEAIMKSGGLRPIDRKSLDESSGLRNFSTIFAEVEKRGYVEPKPIEERMDLVDVTMLEHLNYLRQLNGHGKLEKVPEDIKKKLDSANGKLLGDKDE